MLIYTLEIIIISIIAITALYLTGFFEFYSKISFSKKFIICTFLYLLILSQVLKKPSLTYPFTYWGMYSSSTPTPSYSEHLIKLHDGSIIHYPYEIISFTSQRAVMRRLEIISLSNQYENEILMQETFHSLINIYEKNFPNNKVIEFSLNEVHIKYSKI